VRYFKFILAAIIILLAFQPLHAEEKPAEEKKEEKKESKKNIPREVGAEEIKKAMDGYVKFMLIDTTTPEEYAAGHIRGALNLPMEKLDAETLARLVPDKKERIVFYCEDGECNSASAAAAKAMELGFEKVYKYRTGFKDWKDKGYAIEVSPPAPKAAK